MLFNIRFFFLNRNKWRRLWETRGSIADLRRFQSMAGDGVKYFLRNGDDVDLGETHKVSKPNQRPNWLQMRANDLENARCINNSHTKSK